MIDKSLSLNSSRSIFTDRSTVYQNPHASLIVLRNNKNLVCTINKSLRGARRSIASGHQRYVSIPDIKVVPSHIKAEKLAHSKGTIETSNFKSKLNAVQRHAGEIRYYWKKYGDCRNKFGGSYLLMHL